MTTPEQWAKIFTIVDTDIAHHAMQNVVKDGSLHLPLASHYQCDFPTPWNWKHLANANKFNHIRRINDSLGPFSRF